MYIYIYIFLFLYLFNIFIRSNGILRNIVISHFNESHYITSFVVAIPTLFVNAYNIIV